LAETHGGEVEALQIHVHPIEPVLPQCR